MKMALQSAFAALLLASLPLTTPAHPVEKVIGLLQGLIEKVTTEGKQEEVTYLKFERWCTNSQKFLKEAIADNKESIESLTSEIKSKLEEEATLKPQIAELDEELTKLAAAGVKADTARSSQATLYSDASGDLAATLTAIDQAIAALEGAQATTDGLLLAQRKVKQVLALSAATATDKQRQVLSAFLQDQQQPPSTTESTTTRPVLEAAGDYAGHIKKYDFKSSSVIELLKELRLKFEDDKTAAAAAETNSINAYQLAKEGREDLTNAATASKTEKTAALSAAEDARLIAEGDLNNTQMDLEADLATQSQTEKACTVKAAEWAERSETRKRELEAMKSAIEILSKATGVRTAAPTNPIPPPSPVALLEFSADPKLQAVQILRESAIATHSHVLERLAQEISSHLSGPFDQINNMIQKLIFHLMDEQTNEDKHKNWCDLELNKTDISIGDKTEKLALLKAKIDEAKATVATLTAEQKACEEAVQIISEHVAQITEIRETGKAENAEACEDAQDAQAALSQAISVLTAHYKETSMIPKASWELVQQPVTLPANPPTWDSSYTGVSDPLNQPDGIISVLKKVSAEFASMEAQTKAQEESDQKIYEEDMKSCAIEKARNIKEVEVKGQEKSRLVTRIASLVESHKRTDDEKYKVEQYLKDLQHACVDGDSTYEDRRAARGKEIEALREAQGILAGAFTNETSSNVSLVQQRRLRIASPHIPN